MKSYINFAAKLLMVKSACYERYLERLEELQRVGKISQNAYVRLKYEFKIEELKKRKIKPA